MKISRDFIHKPLISFSDKFTYFPGFYPFTDSNFSMILSISISTLLPFVTI